MGYKSFKNLDVYKKARMLRNDVEDFAKSLPADEKYRLADQMIRSSRAVTAHIVEGHGRYHFKEYIQRCRTGRGELLETDDHLMVALDRKLISDERYKEFEQQINEVERMLNGYISYLKKRLDDK